MAMGRAVENKLIVTASEKRLEKTPRQAITSDCGKQLLMHT
jgi:hypothetical protein